MAAYAADPYERGYDMNKHLDFCIVGAQKSGTTALFHKLCQHPGIAQPARKEFHIFDDETMDWTQPDFGKVAHAFNGAEPSLLWGEATPSYMYWPRAIERLAATYPNIKVIAILRHPAWRALSQWHMQKSRDIESLSFADAISTPGRDRVTHGDDRAKRIWSYVERGFYADQIARLQAHFTPHQLFFCRTDDLYTNEPALLERLFMFLGLAPHEINPGPKMIRPHSTASVYDPHRTEIHTLTSLYHNDIAQTASLTGLDLDHWLMPSYTDPAYGTA